MLLAGSFFPTGLVLDRRIRNRDISASLLEWERVGLSFIIVTFLNCWREKQQQRTVGCLLKSKALIVADRLLINGVVR